MKGRSKKSAPKTLQDTTGAASSTASVDGYLPFDWPDGPPTANAGVPLSPASRSARPAREKGGMMSGTCGRSSFGSSASAALGQSSESKSEASSALSGLMASDPILNPKGMSSSPPVFQRPDLEPLTSASDSSGEPSKACVRCKIVKPLTAFRLHDKSVDGRRYSCAVCERKPEKNRRLKKRMLERSKILIRHAKSRATIKGRTFDLDSHAQEIQAVINAGVCQATGLPFDLTATAAWNSPSLDRIDPSKGYTMENVRVVLYCVNVMSNLWGEGKIVEIANAIMQARQASSDSLQARLTNALKASIGLENSPEYSLAWRVLTMPSGRKIPRLRASLRTSGAGCSGSLQGWPSPMAGSPATEDYNEAGNTDSSRKTVELAGWTTPGASEPDSNTPDRPSRAATGRTTEYLGQQVCGTTSPSSPAATARSGVLNPAFSLWLMGFPSSWLMVAPVKASRGRKSSGE